MVTLSHRARLIKPSATITLGLRAKEMIAEGIDIINFGVGEPDFDTPDHIKEAAIRAIREGETKYTAIGGINPLKDAIIAKYKRENNVTYTRDEIIVSVGAKHSLYNCFLALLNPGDEIIVPAPYWPSYPPQIELAGATPVVVPMNEKDDFLLRPEALEKAITQKTRAFILNTPSNPTGTMYSKEQLQALSEVMVKHKIGCIADEIYEGITYDGFRQTSIASLGDEVKNLTLTINGASKVYAMTGWRMGYTCGPVDVIGAMTKIQGQVTTNINTPTQWACVEAFNGTQEYLKEWLDRFKARRDSIIESLREMPEITYAKPTGAFYFLLNISKFLGKKAGDKKVNTTAELCDYLLEEALVAAVPGSSFGCEGYLRVSYAIKIEEVQKGMTRIKEALRRLS